MQRKSLLLVFFMILGACSPSPDQPSRILIIGSSLIENHGGMDTHIAGLAASRQPALSVEGRIVERGGASLSSLWNSAGTSEAFEDGPWSVLVLQEIALKGPEFGKYEKEKFFEYVRLYNEEIQDNGIETILFMFWENETFGIDEIAADHYEIALELGIKVAPVGLAWQKSLEQRPELELYFTDNVHANVHGNYLAAAVLYATIFEESPEGLPYIPIDVYGDVIISSDDLAYLQSIAWETVQENLEFE